MKCPYCSHEQTNPAAAFCEQCGANMSPTWQTPPSYGGLQTAQPVPSKATSIFALLSFIFGIVSVSAGALTTGLIPLPIVGLVFSIIATKRGYVGNKARIGKILCIIGIVVTIVATIVWGIVYGILAKWAAEDYTWLWY
ncbi:MAG: hypothetical protein FWE84_05675 [Firmicutes bacterium]|nr:hypothetical protein [Bacillota bacterium]